MLHKAIRLFFIRHSTLALERIVTDIQSGVRHSHEILPFQMRLPPIVSDVSSASSRSVASSLTYYSWCLAHRMARGYRKRNTQKGDTVSNSDVEAAAVFIVECMLDDELDGATAGGSSHFGTDNKATEGWYNRKASRASHKAPERFLRWLAMRQRWTRRGPQDVTYYEGERNLLGDFPSCSHGQGFPRHVDNAFLQEFSKRHPLPPQLDFWRLVHPTAEIISAVCSVLRGQIDTQIHPSTVAGNDGAGLPTMLANTLSSLDCKEPTSTWNEATSSWPLLAPCGTVSTTTDDELRHRRSRKRFDGAPNAWLPEDLQTLGEQLRASTSSTEHSPPITRNANE
jgi:hypothetical protein